MAAPWKKLPPGWRVWEDGDPWEEEDDDEDSGGGGDDEGGGDDNEGGDDSGEGGDGSEGGGGGDFDSGEGGGFEGGGSGEEGSDSGGGSFDGEPSWAGDSGAWSDFDGDGDAGDDNAIQREWERDRQEQERDYDANRGRDDFEREYERQRQEAQAEEERQRQQDEFDRQYEENQRLANAFRAQEVSQALPQIGQGTAPDQPAGTPQLNYQPSTTVPPGWTGLFSPPTEEERALVHPPDFERPLSQGAPPPAGSSMTAEQAADWVARGINPITGEPIERTPARSEPISQEEADNYYGTGIPQFTGGPARSQPIPQEEADNYYGTGIPQFNPPAAQPNYPDIIAGPREAAATAAAGATAAGATPAQVQATAEQAARIVWDNQTLAQQTPWTRAAFRSEYGANAEAEWQRQHRAELARNVALYGRQEPTPNTAPIAGAPAGTPNAPNRRIGAVPSPRFGETAQYGLPPSASSAPAVQAAARAAPSTTAPAAAPPERATAPAAPTTAAVPPVPTTGAASTGWTPLPNQPAPKPPIKLPAQPPLPEPEAPTPRTPYTPWRPAPTSPEASAAPGEAAPGESPAPVSTEIADTRVYDEGSREAVENVVDASNLPRQATPIDPMEVRHVSDLSQDVRSTEANGLTSYVEPTGAVFTETPGAEHLLQYQGTYPRVYENAVPITTVVARTENGTMVRFSERDWGWMGPDQQSRYTVVRTEGVPKRGTSYAAPEASATTTPRDINLPSLPSTAPPSGGPTLVTPGSTNRAGDLTPGAIPISPENRTMNGLIRGQRASTSPIMIAGMSTEGETPVASREGLPTASLPTARPPSYDPVTHEPYGTWTSPEIEQVAADPFSGIVDNAGRMQGANDLPGFRASVAGGMVKGEAWAEPYLNDMARMAWYGQSGGREGAPQDAPTSFINDWKSMWRSGQVDAPGIRELNQSMVQAGVAPPTGAIAPLGPPKYPLNAIVPNQFTDKEVQGLPGWEYDAACGITAGMGVARMIGLDPTAKDFLAAAQKQGGWTARYGMGGTAGEVRMLEAMGVPVIAKYDAKGEYLPERATPQAVDAELASGRPVILDTSGSPGHYFAIVGKTPQGYIVSGSGTALRTGSEVMTQQQMENAMGGWRNLIRLDTSRLPQGVNPVRQPAPNQTPAQVATTRVASQMQAAPEQPSPNANLKPSFTGDDAVSMRQRIMAEMPEIQFNSGDDIETRMEKIAPALEWLQKEYGVSAESIAGLAYNENHLGMANSPAVKANNLWSVTYVPQDPLSSGVIPEGRWGRYPSIKAALARFVSMYAHPDNGYRGVWESRGDRAKFFKALRDNKYFVEEPGFEHWEPNTGADLYTRVKNKQVTQKEDPRAGRGY